MDSFTAKRRMALLLAAAVALTAWGTVGFFERLDDGWGAYTYSPDYIVNFVEPGGPGDQAGLQNGDRVISVEGIPVEQLPLYSRWPRSLAPRVGESRRLVVERDGVSLSLDVVYGATRRGVVNLRLGAALVVLSFLWFGIWALLTVRTSHALGLAYIGLAAGLAMFGGGPYLGTWDGVAMHIQTAAMVLWTVLLFRFFLLFPKPKRLGKSRLATWVIYGVWALSLPLLVLELIFHPTLYHTFGPLFSLLMLGYLILALAAVTHTLVKTPRSELRESGMSLILVGLLVAVVPTLVGFIDWAFPRGFSLPGSSYYPLLLVAIPLTMALAVRKQARLGEAQVELRAALRRSM